MPISLNINLPTGVTATYHAVTGGGYGLTSLTTSVNSYLSQAAYAAGDSPLLTTNVDLSPVLLNAMASPSTGETVGQTIFNVIEAALIAQTTSNPQSTPVNPLPNINGIFFGGQIAS